LYNLDYTLQCNGLNLYGDQELTTRAIAESYPGIDRRYIIEAYDMSPYNLMSLGNPQTAVIQAEEGLATMLEEKRDNLLNQAVVAPVDQFESVWESGWNDYLASGGQAIIDERKVAWEAIHGDHTSLDYITSE
jgi:putative aldouronate transport system substrate-binding protein